MTSQPPGVYQKRGWWRRTTSAVAKSLAHKDSMVISSLGIPIAAASIALPNSTVGVGILGGYIAAVTTWTNFGKRRKEKAQQYRKRLSLVPPTEPFKNPENPDVIFLRFGNKDTSYDRKLQETASEKLSQELGVENVSVAVIEALAMAGADNQSLYGAVEASRGYMKEHYPGRTPDAAFITPGLTGALSEINQSSSLGALGSLTLKNSAPPLGNIPVVVTTPPDISKSSEVPWDAKPELATDAAAHAEAWQDLIVEYNAARTEGIQQHAPVFFVKGDKQLAGLDPRKVYEVKKISSFDHVNELWRPSVNYLLTPEATKSLVEGSLKEGVIKAIALNVRIRGTKRIQSEGGKTTYRGQLPEQPRDPASLDKHLETGLLAALRAIPTGTTFTEPYENRARPSQWIQRLLPGKRRGSKSPKQASDTPSQTPGSPPQSTEIRTLPPTPPHQGISFHASGTIAS